MRKSEEENLPTRQCHENDAPARIYLYVDWLLSKKTKLKAWTENSVKDDCREEAGRRDIQWRSIVRKWLKTRLENNLRRKRRENRGGGRLS